MILTKIECGSDYYDAITLEFICNRVEWEDFCNAHPNVDIRRLKLDLCSEMAILQHNIEKVIFNPPATILFMNGKKYVSKAHDEPFDEEKGLLMCLAKANGISHLELKRMIKNAKRQKE